MTASIPSGPTEETSDVPFAVRAVENALGSDRIATQIYGNIRHSVLVGDLPQGARLNEKKLAEALGVSRVPLREALPLLEVHGFIELRARRSAVVSAWTPQRVTELFDVRLSLETTAARLAAVAVREGRPTAALAEAITQADDVLHRGDDLEIAETSTLIHTRIVDLAGNSLMATLMQTISQQMTWLFYLTSRRDSRLACDEHHELLDVIESGDAELAEASMYRHIQKGRKPTLAQVSALQAAPPPAARKKRLELVEPADQ